MMCDWGSDADGGFESKHLLLNRHKETIKQTSGLNASSVSH